MGGRGGSCKAGAWVAIAKQGFENLWWSRKGVHLRVSNVEGANPWG